MSVLVTVLVAAVAAFLLAISYRRVLRLRTQVTHDWKTLDAALRVWRQSVAKIVRAAEDAAIDSSAISKVMDADRAAAQHKGPADTARVITAMDAALTELLALIDQRTDVASSFVETRGALKAHEDLVQRAVAPYNTTAAAYNASISAIPGNLVASLGGFHRAELFQLQ